MDAQNYFCPQIRVPCYALHIGPTKYFSPYVKSKDDLLATKKTAWLKFKFENLEVLCAAVNRNNSAPILTN